MKRLTYGMMGFFSCKKNTYIVDSEGEDDVLCIERSSNSDVHEIRKNVCDDLKMVTMTGVASLKSLDQSLVANNLSDLRMQVCEKDALKDRTDFFVEEKNTENEDLKACNRLFSDEYSVDRNKQDDTCSMRMINDSDDEIQCLGKPYQSKTDGLEMIKDKSLPSVLSKASLNDDKMFQLYQQGNPQIRLLSLAACIDATSLHTKKYEYRNNENDCLKDVEFSIDLKENQLLEEKGRKLRRSRTSKDILENNNGFIKIKRYSSVGAFNACMDNNVSFAQNNGLQNHLSETISNKNVANPVILPIEKFEDSSLNFKISHQPVMNNESVSSCDFTEGVSDNIEKYECMIPKLVNNDENTLLDSSQDLNTLGICEQFSKNSQIKSDCSLSQTSEATENVLENLDTNLLQIENHNENGLESKDKRMPSPMEVLNGKETLPNSNSEATSSVLKETARKNTIKKPCCRVGLSKKAKIESLHFYLRK